MANRSDHPKTKVPPTRPAKKGTRGKKINAAIPHLHKGNIRGRKPTLGTQYPRQ